MKKKIIKRCLCTVCISVRFPERKTRMFNSITEDKEESCFQLVKARIKINFRTERYRYFLAQIERGIIPLGKFESVMIKCVEK